MNRKKVIIRTCSALIALGLVVSCSNKASSSSSSTTPSSSSTPTSSSSTTSPVVQKTLTSISLKNEPTKAEYNLNEALDLTGASIAANYSDGTSETVTVTDKMVTSVDMSSAGSKVVTVSYTVGSVTKTATFTIKVVDNSLKISAVDFTSDVATVRVGSSFTLEAKITPATIAATDLVWTSSNPAIASVSSSGVVSGNAYGNVIVTAASKDGTIKDTIKVYVLLASSSSSAVSTPACSYDAYNDSLTCANPGVADLSAANIADGVNNVTITAGLGNGEISFNNLKVSDKVLINGGGSNSIIFTGSETSINEIDLAKDSSATGSQEPRLELGAGTSVNKITVVQPATVTVNTPTINEIIVKENATIGGSQTVASVSIPSDAHADATVTVTGSVTVVNNALATGVVQGTGSVATVRATTSTTINMDTVVENLSGSDINVAIQGSATNALAANTVQEVKNSSTNTASIGEISVSGAGLLTPAYITDGYALIDLKLYPNDRTALQTKYATLLSTLVSTPANLTDAEKSLASATDVKTYLLTGFTATPYLVSFKIDLDGTGSGAAVDYTSLIANGDGKLEVKKNLANSTETPTYEYTYMAADGTSTPVSSANFQKSSASFTVDYKVAGSFAPDSVSLTPSTPSGSLDFGSFELSYVVSDNLIYSAQTDADIAAIIAANNGNDINIISGTTSTNTVKVSVDATGDKPTYHIDAEQDIKDVQALWNLSGTALDALESTLKLGANVSLAKSLTTDSGWTSSALTLDLNNLKLEYAGTYDSNDSSTTYGLLVQTGCSLIIDDSSTYKGGSIQNNVASTSDVIRISGGTVTMNNGEIKSTAIGVDAVRVHNAGYFELQGGSLASTNYLGVFIRDAGSKLTVTGGSISGKDYAVSGNGSTGLGDTIIDISGGSLTATNTSDGTAIYQPQTGTLTISGGTLTGYNGIYAKAGTINISGGTITGNGAKVNPSPYGNGFNVTGDAIMLDTMKGAYVGNIHLTVTGGTIQATNENPGYAIQSVDNRDTETTKSLPTVSLKDVTFPSGVTQYCAGTTLETEAEFLLERVNASQLRITEGNQAVDTIGDMLTEYFDLDATGDRLTEIVSIFWFDNYHYQNKFNFASTDAVQTALADAVAEYDKIVATFQGTGGYATNVAALESFISSAARLAATSSGDQTVADEIIELAPMYAAGYIGVNNIIREDIAEIINAIAKSGEINTLGEFFGLINTALGQVPTAEGLGYTISVSSGAGTITGYTGSETALEIPNNLIVDGVIVPVEKIGFNAFKDKTSLTSVILPRTLKGIGQYAFAGCTGLTTFVIPDSVTTMDTNAFKGCTNLTAITIGSGLTYITNNVFEGCSKLNNVIIPANVTSLGKDTFKDCVALDTLTITGNVHGTKGGAFSGCSALDTVTIGSGVTSIGNYLFQNHAALTSINIPEGVTELGQFAFAGTGLTSITIPSNLTTLGNYVFQNCQSLTSVEIPDTVTSLGTYAFSGCTELKSVTLGSGLTEIKGYTFAQCPSLTEIVLPGNITSVGMSAFIGTWQSNVWVGENLNKITLGADVTFDGDTFGTARNTLKTTYAADGAGTYTFADGSWSKIREK